MNGKDTTAPDAAAFSEAVTLAKGCVDYGGGHNDDGDREVFHHGIQTVVNVLEHGHDFQTRAILRVGLEIEAENRADRLLAYHVRKAVEDNPLDGMHSWRINLALAERIRELVAESNAQGDRT